VVIFPGGVGTAEELLYLLGILMHPENRDHPFPVILSGPARSADYFEALDSFVAATLGAEAQGFYRVIIDDPVVVARKMREAMEEVEAFRRKGNDAFYFNWQMHIEKDFQEPFIPTHEAMAGLAISRGQAPHHLAANLRRLFSGIVAGNVKDEGIRAVEELGPFQVHAEADLAAAMDDLLQRFVAQRRMKLEGEYRACYHIIR
jgi:hypothetical protein